jgi:CRP-like cAMP-binding protein
MTPVATAKKRPKFDTKTFLSTIDGGRKIAAFPKKQTVFVQGDSSDAVFYIQKGKVRLTVVSQSGKEATIGILNEGDFFGESCLAGQTLRLFSATANDRLLGDANRQEVHDRGSSPGTRVFRHVRGIFADTEHPIRGGFGRSAFQFE